MSEPNFSDEFEAITQTLGSVDVRRVQLEEAAKTKRVQDIIHEWQRTRHYDSLEACDALGPFGLSPWDIDIIIPLYMSAPEAFHGEA